MNWFKKLFQPAAKSVSASPEFAEYFAETTGLRSKVVRADYRSLAQEGYMANSAVYAAIDELATAAAGIPWAVVRDVTENEVRLQVPDMTHPLNELLKRASPEQSWLMFIKKITATWLLSGNLYLHRTKPKLEIRSLRPDQMSAITNGLGMVVKWKQTFDNGQVRIYSLDTILHIKDFHPLKDDVGMSRLQSATLEIDITNEGQAWNLALLRNGARPSGILHTEANLDEEQYRRLREERKILDQGAANAGGLMITEGGLKFQPMGMDPGDLDFHNGMKTNRRNIWSVLNTPPELVGDSEAKTYSNYKEARQALYKENILPLLDLLAAELNLWLNLDEDVSLSFSVADVEALQPDVDALHDRIRKDVEAGIITTNEGREALGLTALTDEPDADHLRIVPGTTLGSEERMPPEAGPNTGGDNGNSPKGLELDAF